MARRYWLPKIGASRHLLVTLGQITPCPCQGSPPSHGITPFSRYYYREEDWSLLQPRSGSGTAKCRSEYNPKNLASARREYLGAAARDYAWQSSLILQRALPSQQIEARILQTVAPFLAWPYGPVLITTIESRMFSPSSDGESNTRPRQKPGSACEECRRRKLRCDRERPQCGVCFESNVACKIGTFRARGPRRGHLKALKTRICTCSHTAPVAWMAELIPSFCSCSREPTRGGGKRGRYPEPIHGLCPRVCLQ